MLGRVDSPAGPKGAQLYGGDITNLKETIALVSMLLDRLGMGRSTGLDLNGKNLRVDLANTISLMISYKKECQIRMRAFFMGDPYRGFKSSKGIDVHTIIKPLDDEVLLDVLYGVSQVLPSQPPGDPLLEEISFLRE